MAATEITTTARQLLAGDVVLRASTGTPAYTVTRVGETIDRTYGGAAYQEVRLYVGTDTMLLPADQTVTVIRETL